MSVDQTAFFKARAKTLSQRKVKETGAETLEDEVPPASNRLSYKNICSFAEGIRRDAADFYHLVISRRRDYLTFNTPYPPMSNKDRDSFDQESEKALLIFSNSLDKLSTRISDEKLNEMERQHLRAVIEIMRKYLKQIAKTVTSMRELRIRNTRNVKNNMSFASLTRVYREKRNREQHRHSPFEMVESQILRRRHGADETPESDVFVVSDIQRSSLSEVLRGAHVEQKPSVIHHEAGDTYQNDPIIELSEPDQAQMVMENERIFAKFAQSNVEMNKIESQIVELQNLQETLAEKLTTQDKDIELINETAIHTSENLRDGNEWIRQAISNSAGRRVILLFCVVVITISLLFLDWYNP